MMDSLPPSKFGAGYTYGGNDAAAQTPSPAPPPYTPPAPTYPQSTPPSYSQPPAYAPPPPTATPYQYGAMGGGQYAGSASGATAIIAGILALLLGAFRAYTSIDLVKGLIMLAKLSGPVGMYMDKSVYFWSIAYAVASILVTALLLLGGIVLLSRGRPGRTMIIFGTLLILGEAILTWAAATIFLQAAGMFGGGAWDLGATTFVAFMIFAGVPAVTLVLALLPSTKKWCR